MGKKAARSQVNSKAKEPTMSLTIGLCVYSLKFTYLFNFTFFEFRMV